MPSRASITASSRASLASAAALRVSPRTIQEMVSAEEIPVVRIRGAVRFYLPDVVRCLTATALTSKRGCAHGLAAEVEQ